MFEWFCIRKDSDSISPSCPSIVRVYLSIFLSFNLSNKKREPNLRSLCRLGFPCRHFWSGKQLCRNLKEKSMEGESWLDGEINRSCWRFEEVLDISRAKSGPAADLLPSLSSVSPPANFSFLLHASLLLLLLLLFTPAGELDSKARTHFYTYD